MSFLDDLEVRLSQPVDYSSHEEAAIRPYNLFMMSVVQQSPVRSLGKNHEMTFCLYAACVLEEAWKKYVLPEEPANELRFLEVLVRYLLNVMKVPEATVTVFIKEGHDLVSKDLGDKVARLATSTFEDFTNGDLSASAAFKFFAENM